MTSQWTPNPGSLDQLAQILSGTLSNDTSVRKAATEALTKATAEPDFDNYLLHILSAGHQLEPQIRASAGLLMKNDLLKNWGSKSPELKQHILQEIPKGLVDPQPLVRNITGNVITSLFSILGVAHWPNILPNLMELATGAASPESQEGAMSTLAKISEDSARTLDREYDGQRPLNYMVPKFIELTGHQSGRIRELALTCLNNILVVKSQAILTNLDLFMERLFQLATDNDPKVRTGVCTAFASIIETSPEKLFPHMDGVIDYSLHSMNDDDEEVALQACEVILSTSSAEIPPELIRHKLPDIIPVLLKKMVYSEMEVFLMEGQDENDDENVADKDEDIRPQVARSKDAHGTTKKEDSDDSDEDEDDLDLNPSWTLRKCSAASLDILASQFASEVLTISLPVVKERVASPEWPIREAAILALGAIAEGCWEQASSQLPELIPYLVERLHDPQPRVRQITCWTLGRYAGWVCQEAQAGGSCASYFNPTFEAIMACARDTKKVVQQSACSALTDFIENAEPDLIGQYIEPLLQNFQEYFRKYQRKNLIILYDTVQTFAERVGDQLRYNEQYINMLLPPLIEKWQQLQDDDKDLWPLLECMSSVAAVLGESFAPYAVPVYERAVRILDRCIQEDQMAHNDANFDAPEKDFIVTSLDLIDGLVEGLAHHFGELANDSLMRLILTCFDDTNDDVRQSAYALLGDLSLYLLEPLVVPNLHEVMVNIGIEISNLNYDSTAAVNNAIWALGEIAIRIPHEAFSPYLDNFMKVLVPLLQDPQQDTTLLENTAITIGRMGINNAEAMGPYVPAVLPTWCSYMRYLEDNEEKQTAFEGMCRTIQANPTTTALAPFIDCIGSYRNPGETRQTFQNFLTGVKNGLGEQGWNSLLQSVESKDGLKYIL